MSIETSVEIGYGMIITEEELDHLNSCICDNQDDPAILGEWEDFYDDYIRPIDTYNCDTFFMGVADDLGVDAGCFRPYPTEPIFDGNKITTFVKRMFDLQINKFLDRLDLQTYLLHFLY